jgi:hypothetical protein
VREAEKLEKQRKELEKQSKTQGKMTATEQETTAGELEPTDTTKEIKLTEDNKKNEGQPKETLIEGRESVFDIVNRVLESEPTEISQMDFLSVVQQDNSTQASQEIDGMSTQEKTMPETVPVAQQAIKIMAPELRMSIPAKAETRYLKTKTFQRIKQSW